MINWDEKLSTGDARIDSQHKVLIEKLNELEEAFSGNSVGEIRRTAGEALDFLQFYAAWHFEQEEAAMAQVNCPAADENKRAHADFLKQFGQFYSQWQTSSMNLDLARTTYNHLASWVTDHILAVDVQIKPFVQN
jgi:hemerythrin-like metal-binding protein